jgi:DNA helicase-2/ATP-dependent DNA helicase PcrA
MSGHVVPACCYRPGVSADEALDPILAPLNDEQRRAAQAVRGPVAILAGAGTGKTTTITHRIAFQVASGAFPATSLLAVTFTEKAARELRQRLAALGVHRVEARTFHAAALWQLNRLLPRYGGRELPQILDSKAPLIASMANALPPPHRFMPRSELAGEIEWAKNRMVTPDGYLDELVRAEHTPPIPAELMHGIFDGYERRKQRAGRMDFEDMLGSAVQLYHDSPAATAAVHDRFAAFTVDEYQDVNPLQQALLDAWLGDRDELCVVGDDYQSIYSFTGASPRYLLGFPDRYPEATVIRLEENYRSSPQILAVANALTPSLGGSPKTLRATRPDGANPTARPVADTEAETAFVVSEVRALQERGVAFEEMAVLYRINARSEPFEEAFAAAGIPYQVRDGAFLRRPGPRAVLARLRRTPTTDVDVVELVEAATDEVGFDADADPDDTEEVTRQADLARLRTLAIEYRVSAGEAGDTGAFVAELTSRFSTEQTGRGVNLLTYHRAKGLEFDAVFLPRLLDKELPFRSQRSAADPQEERRLLYVGITRARSHLFLSWPQEPRSTPSPFLQELGVEIRAAPVARAAARTKGPAVSVSASDAPTFDRLKEWRRKRAATDGVPAYVVFHDKTLAEIAERLPRDWADMAAIPGVGPAKLERYADEILAVLGAA